jgi:hypothetical protein
MADPISISLMAASTLLSAGSQLSAGRTAAKEAELSAQTAELGATQREVDRKERLAQAMATANAQAGAAGIAAFEGSPLTILQQSIENEQTATERDQFNTRVSTLMTRARGKTAKRQAQVGAFTSLLQGGSNVAQLIPEA